MSDKLPYEVEQINIQLVSIYGIDTESVNPIWRVTFSDSEYENRYGTFEDYTEAGIYLRTVTETRLCPKYQHVKGRYILERLVAVPEFQQHELAGAKISYELMWVFEDKYSNPLPPQFLVCQIVIHAIYSAMGKKDTALYVDKSPEETQKEIERIHQELFGNETAITDNVRVKQGIFVPSSYLGDN